MPEHIVEIILAYSFNFPLNQQYIKRFLLLHQRVNIVLVKLYRKKETIELNKYELRIDNLYIFAKNI